MAIDNSGTSYQRGTSAAPIGARSFYHYGGLAPNPSLPTPALVITTLGANANLQYTSADADDGIRGNGVTVSYVVAGNSTPLSVTVSGQTITVGVATSSGGAATSTATQVLAAVNGNAAASALVTATLAPGNDGTGVVAAGTWVLSGARVKHATVGHARMPTIPPIYNNYG